MIDYLEQYLNYLRFEKNVSDNSVSSYKNDLDLYKEALKNDYTLFFEHDLYNECCTLHQTEKGVRVKETFTLEEYKHKVVE